MPTFKEIRTKISTIRKTQKITKAMQMVAASKMRKAEQRMQISMPYADKLRTVMGHVSNSHSEYRHQFLQRRDDVSNVGYIVIATDRGLCGGLNFNLFRLLGQKIDEWHSKEVSVNLCLFGGKAVNYFRYFNRHVNTLARAYGYGDNPRVKDFLGGVVTMVRAYEQRKIDRLYIAHNKFISKMSQKPQLIQLLPLELAEDDSKVGYWDYIYEPDAKQLLDVLIRRYIETQVYQAVVDNLACEQAARMLAMKNATDNANKVIAELGLIYNKARQAAITREIADIINGSESV